MCKRAAYHQGGNHHHDLYSHWMEGKKRRRRKHKRFRIDQSLPSVNIQELDDKYELFLSAPGLSKEAIKISLTNNYLMISAERKEFELGENARWKKFEFAPGGFNREFELNDKIDLESITAKYEEGILYVTLPKIENSVTSRHDINIA